MEHTPKPSRAGQGASPGEVLSKRRYDRLFITSILAVMLVSVIPLVSVVWIKHFAYEEALLAEQVRPISRLTSNAKHSLEFFVSERLSALSLVIQEKPIEELSQQDRLRRVLTSVKRAFGGFTDLGLIDDKGVQVSYAGPYNLQGKRYEEQDWYREVMMRGVYVSDVFMGYRKFPHFVIAVRYDTADGKSFILRATIESETINKLMLRYAPRASSDAFLVTRNKILQTPSRQYGNILDTIALPSMPLSNEAEIIETKDRNGERLIMGYAYVSRSPFIVVLVSRPDAVDDSLFTLRRNLVLILVPSVLLITLVVVGGVSYMVRRLREADIRQAAIYHKMEYTNRMAVIGRLAAGVAHEINNPLSIIGEKAGLLSDLLRLSKKPPSNEKVLGITDDILKSVDRCSTITHRLLGFAKHMDVKKDKMDLKLLLEEVLGFLEKEAHYRNLRISLETAPELPFIESDRGQLQQLFLNIINNAFAAVDDGGEIDIAASRSGNDQVQVTVTDNGIGIPEENIPHLFEPFFTTKEESGTGLGLSITYGIVEKLGGKISVKSKVSQGTTFTVTLPVTRK